MSGCVGGKDKHSGPHSKSPIVCRMLGCVRGCMRGCIGGLICVKGCEMCVLEDGCYCNSSTSTHPPRASFSHW